MMASNWSRKESALNSLNENPCFITKLILQTPKFYWNKISRNYLNLKLSKTESSPKHNCLNKKIDRKFA